MKLIFIAFIFTIGLVISYKVGYNSGALDGCHECLIKAMEANLKNDEERIRRERNEEKRRNN